jgi:ABC-type phosphate transport system permease subunit
MRVIKIIDLITLILAIPAFAFGAWGLYSDAGRKEFRELAYVIPDLSMKLGLVLFFAHVVLLIVAYAIKKKQVNNKGRD